MTNRITIRLRRPKAEIAAKAKPNINAWINDLVEQALELQKPNWEAVLARRARGTPRRYCSDEIRKADR